MVHKKFLEKLSKLAYETHIKNAGAGEITPESRVVLWESLPEYTREHWRKITEAILRASWNLDYGDLDD